MLAVVSYGADVLGIEGESHSSIGIYIKDIKADTVVFESDADRTLIPASITKALTSASAMTLLPKNYRYETKVYLSGNIESGVVKGNVVVLASGDPTLESEHFPKNKGFVADIVKAIKEKGITEIEGRIVLERVNEDRQYLEGPIERWEIDDTPWAYGAGVFDFNWEDNYYSLYPVKGETRPHVPDVEVTLWKKPLRQGNNLLRGIYSNHIVVIGKDYTANNKSRVNTSMPYPFDVFACELEAKLKSSGIKVVGKKLSPENRRSLLTHKSPELDEILRSLMLRSDNTFAEGVLRQFGNRYGDRDASVRAELELWAGRGLETRFVTVLDGSGLSRGNQISPRFMGDMLAWMARSDNASRYVSLFPVAGRSGTMKNFMSKTELAGRLAMKTGSMSAVQSYAGYLLDEKGQPTHVVVVIANSFFCSRASLKDAIADLLLRVLTEAPDACDNPAVSGINN